MVLRSPEAHRHPAPGVGLCSEMWASLEAGGPGESLGLISERLRWHLGLSSRRPHAAPWPCGTSRLRPLRDFSRPATTLASSPCPVTSLHAPSRAPGQALHALRQGSSVTRILLTRSSS